MPAIVVQRLGPRWPAHKESMASWISGKNSEGGSSKVAKFASTTAARSSIAPSKISQGGAALQVEGSTGIPEEFNLIISPDNIVRACEIVWKTETQIGVAFVWA